MAAALQASVAPRNAATDPPTVGSPLPADPSRSIFAADRSSPTTDFDHEKSRFSNTGKHHINLAPSINENRSKNGRVDPLGDTQNVVASERANAGGVPRPEAASQPSGRGATLAVAHPDGPTSSGRQEQDHKPDSVIERVVGDARSRTRSISTLPKRSRATNFDDDHWCPAVADVEARVASMIEALDDGRPLDRARGLLAEVEDDRARQRATPPGASTLRQYRSACDLFDRRRAELGAGRGGGRDKVPPPASLERTLGEYTANRKTFAGFRSALRYRAQLRLRRAMSEAEGMIECPVDTEQGLRSLAAVALLADDLEHFRATTFDSARECRRSHGQPDLPVHRSRSKRRMLRSQQSDWRERYLENERRAGREAEAVVMRYSGLRPAELQMGVVVTSVDDKVHMHIHGAKVREFAGQAERTLVLHREMLPKTFIATLSHAGGRLVVQARADPMRMRLARLTLPVLGKVRLEKDGKPQLLSAYLFRHALVTDLRRAGWSDEEIAPVIGEQSAETVRRCYGVRVRSGRLGPVAIVRGATVATSPVRPLRPSRADQMPNSGNTAVSRAKRRPNSGC